MDPLSALSVAVAIVQFVDFSANLLSTAHEIFLSPSGLSGENANILEVYESLNNLSQRFVALTDSDDHNGSDQDKGDGTGNRIFNEPLKNSHVAKDMSALRMLARNCKSDCDTIVKVIQGAIAKDGKNRLWRSVKSAVRSSLNKSKIQDLESNIERAQGILALHLQSIISQQLSELKDAVRELTSKSRALEMQHIDGLDTITKGIDHLKVSLCKQDDASETQPNLPSARQLQALVETVEGSLSAKKETAKAQAIVASLCFSYRPARHASITNAHTNTYNWIYESHFLQWLKEGSGVFWVMGKAGSGKSTLMKFISDHPETRRLVAEWASPKEAVVASHYFWGPGTDMQKSHQGLLRSLLFDIYRQCPSLIPNTTLDQSRLQKDDEQSPWTLPELSEALCQIGSQSEIPVQFCLFVDGLDEYAGEHYELCETIKEVARCPRIKICISSRPWNVFEAFFGTDKSATLAIHERTKDDIRLFVQDRLEGHPRWQEWADDNNRHDDLVQDIVKRAEGVFLWAFLVTKSLREGLTNEDTADELRRRLQSLPTNLEELFKHMLDGVDPIYHEKMAGMLQIAVQANFPLPWQVYDHHDQEYADPDYAIKPTMTVPTPDQLIQRRRRTRRRINARSRGLLELRRIECCGYRRNAEFLHRTVYDFLSTDELSSYLSAKRKTDFSAHFSILKAYVSWIKSIRFVRETEQGLEYGERLDTLVNEALYYASSISDHHVNGMITVVDELERFFVSLAKEKEALCEETKRNALSVFRKNILTCNVVTYLSPKLSQTPLYLSALNVPPLIVALYKRPTPMETLTLLLKHGQDPNQCPNSAPSLSPWCCLVQAYCHTTAPIHKLNIALRKRLFTCFLEHGADPNSNIVEENGGRLSAFAKFLMPILSNMVTAIDLENYSRELTSFLDAGADLEGGINPEPLRRFVNSSPFFTQSGSTEGTETPSQLSEDSHPRKKAEELTVHLNNKAEELNAGQIHCLSLILTTINAANHRDKRDVSGFPRKPEGSSVENHDSSRGRFCETVSDGDGNKRQMHDTEDLEPNGEQKRPRLMDY